jgi:L,D-transpeptidase catalytic domain
MRGDFALGRRDFLTGVAAVAGTTLSGAGAFARPADRALADIAKRELARAGRKVWLGDMVGIADFSLPSYQPRFFVVDMLSGKVRPFLVSHGMGSDPQHSGWLRSFSNEFNSLATSRGSYLTHTWYDGQNGTSLRLTGLDVDNSNAEARAIVIHGAKYANPDMIPLWGKLGRSSGCFAFPEANLMEILARLGPGRLLFADRLEGDIAPPLPPAASVTNPSQSVSPTLSSREPLPPSPLATPARPAQPPVALPYPVKR